MGKEREGIGRANICMTFRITVSFRAFEQVEVVCLFMSLIWLIFGFYSQTSPFWWTFH